MNMVTQMQDNLLLSEEQICAGFYAAVKALDRANWCHIYFGDGVEPMVVEFADKEAFARSVSATDANLLVGLAQYEAAHQKKFALFSSPHASVLSALPGKD
jgi:hypothetical protein